MACAIRSAPFDPLESAGTLARDTQLDGVWIPAGSRISRDIDFDYVIATLAEPVDVLGVRLCEGTTLHLYRANPRAIGGWVFFALWQLPLTAMWFVVMGIDALGRGTWRQPRARAEKPRPSGGRIIA